MGYRMGVAAVLAVAVAAMASMGMLVAGATAPAPCANSQAANARTTTSVDGTKVFGSACPDRIIVRSPLVREVQAGGGNDTIFIDADVEVVDGGEGDDVIHGELAPGQADVPPPSEGVIYGGKISASPQSTAGSFASASITEKKCEAGKSCYGGVGSQLLIGSGGNDKIFGQRGNDELFGNGGNDELFGGIGDEGLILGGAGNDLISGGLGADNVDGGAESDLVRGDATIDTIQDTGLSGTDTLSFATGVAPGFGGEVPYTNFPGESERGVSVRLDGVAACGTYQACDNSARFGGGNDELNVFEFENIIGTPFADLIIGTAGDNRIDGGGGADVILGKGGNDTIYGGADGDYLQGDGGTDTVYGQGGTNNCAADVETKNQCSGSAEAVVQRNTGKISVGFMATEATTNWVSLYLAGSSGADRVTAALALEGGTGYVTFTSEGESPAQFDTSTDAASTGCAYEATKVKCTLPKMLDSLVIAGLAGNDRLALAVGETFWETTTPILLGGEGNDELIGAGPTEDLLVDGSDAGSDVIKGMGSDDGLLNNEGADTLEGGNGNDLLVSSGTCQGDVLQGAEASSADGTAQNNASFAQVPSGSPGVVADLESEGEFKGTAGNSYSGGPFCASGSLNKLRNIDDLEATNGNDILYGDKFANNLLGRSGKDQIWARVGDDNIEAVDGEVDEGGGSTGTDTCSLDGSDKFSSCNP